MTIPKTKTNATVSRRGFMVGCSSAIAAMAGARLSLAAFGNAEAEPNNQILLVIFLRGGLDGLSLVPPLDGPDRGHYEANREFNAVPTSGDNRALRLDDRFGLNPAAAPLMELFEDQNLAIIHAAGLTSDTRSHFDAMRYMELGTPESQRSTSGWLTRHVQTMGSGGMGSGGMGDGGDEMNGADILVPSLSIGNMTPTSLAGSTRSIGMTRPDQLSLNGNWRFADWQRQALRGMYGSADSWLHQSGLRTLDAIDIIEGGVTDEYTPRAAADYPQTGFGRNLQTVAQLIKLQLGLTVATVDLGGWDTHEYQGTNGGGYFGNRIGNIAQSLHAFYTDLHGSGSSRNAQRVTTVVMSEFGRSLKENGSRGTDHGHGNVMLVLGDQIAGGKVYGEWPGLARDQLYDGRDLAITTDYRRVLSEVLREQLGNPHIGTVFPGYSGYEPLGLIDRPSS